MNDTTAWISRTVATATDRAMAAMVCSIRISTSKSTRSRRVQKRSIGNKKLADRALAQSNPSVNKIIPEGPPGPVKTLRERSNRLPNG